MDEHEDRARDPISAGHDLGRLNASLRVAIQYLPLHKMRQAEDNPRRHPKKQVTQIAKSIKAFGFLMPLVASTTGEIVVGHGRYLAAQSLRLTEIPVISVEHLSATQLRALRIADNKLTENAIWDDRLLAEQLKELSSLEIDFDVEITGFEMGEIDFRVMRFEADRNATEERPEPKIAAGPSVARVGDVWQLGPHRVLCGDALSRESVAELVGSDRAAMAFLDPPYNVPIHGHVSGKGAIKHREFQMAVGEKSRAEFTTFLRSAMQEAADVCEPGSLFYLCMDWRHTIEAVTAGEAACGELKNICVWTKDNAGMGSLYRSQHEFVLVFKVGNCPHRNNIQLGKHGRNRSNVWPYAGINSFARNTAEGNLLELHPTVKPVEMIADAILDCTARNDIVLDTFLGSGSTLIAAERVSRRCLGIEIDPLYVDTIIRRWLAMTGAVAILTGSGHTFAEVSRERNSDDGE